MFKVGKLSLPNGMLQSGVPTASVMADYFGTINYWLIGVSDYWVLTASYLWNTPINSDI